MRSSFEHMEQVTDNKLQGHLDLAMENDIRNEIDISK